jgi:hypothetical protein
VPLFNQSGYGSGRYGIADGGPIYFLPLAYYLNLFTSEYRLAPKLNAFALSLLSPLDDVSNVLFSMSEALDLDYAIGAQLDTLGLLQGVTRVMTFQPTGDVSPVLDDDTFRTFIRAQIARNQWDGLESSLGPIWATLFPGGSIFIDDQQNMTADIVMSGAFTSIVKDLISNGLIVPRPEGVQYNYIFADLPILGFDQDNSFIAGVDQGHFA